MQHENMNSFFANWKGNTSQERQLYKNFPFRYILDKNLRFIQGLKKLINTRTNKIRKITAFPEDRLQIIDFQMKNLEISEYDKTPIK